MDTRTCSRCKRDQPVDNFGIKKSGFLQSACKECQRGVSKEWYANNKKRQIANARRNTAKMKSTITQWKQTLSCSMCPESYHKCLDFHHLDGADKDNSIAALWLNAAMPVIIAEINKCILLCSNCHRKVHAGILDVSNVKRLNITKDTFNLAVV